MRSNVTRRISVRRSASGVGTSPALSIFGRYGWRDLGTDDQPLLPLPSGGSGNGHIYARNKQLVAGTSYVPGNSSLLEVRFGWSTTEGGKTSGSRIRASTRLRKGYRRRAWRCAKPRPRGVTIASATSETRRESPMGNHSAGVTGRF